MGESAKNCGAYTHFLLWLAERVRAGNWTPVQWLDGALADAALDLEANALLEPIGLRYDIGSAGQ